MAQYRRLACLVHSVDPRSPDDGLIRKVVPYLLEVWLDDYHTWTSHKTEIVETSVSDFSYLFDIGAERLIAAWGISKGRHGEARDASRMAGHPLSAGPLYHRGHAIPHTLGGPTDINLVPQLGRINIGPFRPLEKKAVATQGSLYFTYWTYLGQRTGRVTPLVRRLLALIKDYSSLVSLPKSLTTVTDDKAILPRCAASPARAALPFYSVKCRLKGSAAIRTSASSRAAKARGLNTFYKGRDLSY